jgi:hypothetical protein
MSRLLSYHSKRGHLRELLTDKLITIPEYKRIKQIARSPLTEDRVMAEVLIVELRRKQLLELLEQCSSDNQEVFKRMYWYAFDAQDRKPETPVTLREMVNGVSLEKISWAIKQCKNTLNHDTGRPSA